MHDSPLRTASLLLLGVALAVTASRADAQTDTTPPVILVTPVFTPSSRPDCPLVARLQYNTNEPATTEIVLLDGLSSVRAKAESTASLAHDVAVAGMRPGTTYDIRMSAVDVAGNRTVWPGTFHMTTPALPSTFPPLHTTVSFPTRMEPGITLFVTFFSSSTVPGSGGYVIAVDAAGRVIWFYFTREHISNVERMHNGHLLLLASPFQALEIDLLGNLVNRYWAHGGGLVNMPPGSILVNTDQFHHEFHEIENDPSADFICLSTEIRQYPNYPADEVNTGITDPVANVAGEIIVELKRDGTVVRETRLLDILDPYRICYGSLAGFYDNVYGLLTKDWGHCNSVIIDPTDDNYVVSLRCQDCVVKIGRDSGQLMWIHGDPGRWVAPWSSKLLTPVGPNFSWQYHQHGPHIDANGTLTLFDNGNYRVIPPLPFAPTSAWYSRGAKFHIDPVAMTTELQWEYRGAQPFFSGFLGDCDPLPQTGNVLICDGAKQVPNMNKTFARLVEVNSRPLGKVFEIIVNDPAVAANPYNWNIYRGQRWPDIYAGP